jgi:hypothetical protein
MRVSFFDPHHPWQRCTNENTNRLLRQYLHKNADLGMNRLYETIRPLCKSSRSGQAISQSGFLG